jgi:multicomponent Na+:H+ antiporter subunit E
MGVTLFLAAPIAALWTVISSSLSLGSFAVGYVLGVALLTVLQVSHVQIDHRRLPDQAAALLIYSVTLARDILLPSLDVARRVLDPQLPLHPGVIAVSTQDERESDYVAAFSAHGITITPGELVVDFDGGHTMVVHCLDTEASRVNADVAQARRLRLLRRIEGSA